MVVMTVCYVVDETAEDLVEKKVASTDVTSAALWVAMMERLRDY